MELNEQLDQVRSIFELEFSSYQKIEGNVLEVFKNLFYIDWELKPVYFSTTSLIFTSINDYKAIASKMVDIEEVLSIDMPDYNLSLHLLRYHNNKLLSGLLRQ
jgi:hypothetical protein